LWLPCRLSFADFDFLDNVAIKDDRRRPVEI